MRVSYVGGSYAKHIKGGLPPPLNPSRRGRCVPSCVGFLSGLLELVGVGSLEFVSGLFRRGLTWFRLDVCFGLGLVWFCFDLGVLWVVFGG